MTTGRMAAGAALAFGIAFATVQEAGAFVRLPQLPGDAGEGLRVMAENVYGVRPEFPDFRPTAEVVRAEPLAGGLGTKKTVRINTMTPLGEKTFEAQVFLPKRDGKAPAFVNLVFGWDELKSGRCPTERILARGCAVAVVCYNDVLKDVADVLKDVRRPENGWGAISTWALAASRVADWLETEPAVDASRLAVIGHSRLGKTALWAGANDKRFALTCSNDSGCLGARLSAFNVNGETIRRITTWFPHWFAPKCATFSDKDDSLPFDQHWLMAAIAPRLLAIGSADGDWWACPAGELAGYQVTKQVYEAQKAADNIDYHIRHGKHDIMPEDWDAYMDFAARRGWPVLPAPAAK